MNLEVKLAFTYLFSRKSSQAIHWITGISVFGIAVGSAALILVLSVFNGFEVLLSGMFSKHNPDIKIIARKGKHFTEDPAVYNNLMRIAGVDQLSRSMEEVAMFQYSDAQEFGLIRGVDSNYVEVCSVREGILEGNFALGAGAIHYANVGMGLRNKLGLNLRNFHEPLRVFVPDQNGEQSTINSYRDYSLLSQSVFNFHQESDYTTVITDLAFIQHMLNKPKAISAYEIKLKKGAHTNEVIRKMEQILGNDFIVKDRYKQDEAFMKIMRLEKWLFYSLFCLTLLLVSFTIVGTLWMIVLEKRFDISVLKSMGMVDGSARRVFILLGLLICFIGLVLGFSLAILFYFLQRKYGLIGVPEEFIIDSYPIAMQWTDFIIVSITVLSIGWLASQLPSRKIGEIKPIFHEE